jgi:D-sedoheptulose 7-phosphate isomerase
VLAVPSTDTQIVQELHLVAVHLLCTRLDELLLPVLSDLVVDVA